VFVEMYQHDSDRTFEVMFAMLLCIYAGEAT